jgi:hypothetical protein
LAFFLLLVCTSFAIHFDAGKKKKNRRKCRVTLQLPTPDRVCQLRGEKRRRFFFYLVSSQNERRADFEDVRIRTRVED